jgi:acylphosphatase
MRHARRYRIHGLVQGVGFRFFASDAARRENIHGWVCNLADGTVEVVAEGEAESVERFAHRLHEGPHGSRVDKIETHEEFSAGHSGGFQIR